MSVSPENNADLLSRRERWDLEPIQYDLGAYDFVGWVENQIRDEGYDLSSLDRLHEMVPKDDVLRLVQRISKRTRGQEFRDLYRRFVFEVLEPLAGTGVAAQRFPNLRALPPDSPEMCIPFHTDNWYGHSVDELNVWLPLTPTFTTNSMAVIDADLSERLVREAIDKRMTIPEMNRRWLQFSHPVESGPGRALLFTPLHLHGNIENKTGRTRMSFDFRLALQGGRLNKKLPGGYFLLAEQMA